MDFLSTPDDAPRGRSRPSNSAPTTVQVGLAPSLEPFSEWSSASSVRSRSSIQGDGALQLGSGRQLALVAVLVLQRERDRLRRPARRRAVGRDASADGGKDRPQLDLAAAAPSSATVSSRSRPATGSASRTASSTASASSGPSRAATSTELTAALALWRGAPLSQFAYERFAQREIARLEELRLTAIEARVERTARARWPGESRSRRSRRSTSSIR